MPSILYSDLFNGLQALRRQSDDRRQRLQTQLSQGQPISADNEQWLDGAANLTDKTLLIDKLAEAPDIEQAFDTLSLPEKNIVTELQRLAQESRDRGTTRNSVASKGTKRKGVSSVILN